jgi:hypothetical protein
MALQWIATLERPAISGIVMVRVSTLLQTSTPTDDRRHVRISEFTSGLIFNLAWSLDGQEVGVAHGREPIARYLSIVLVGWPTS